MIDCINCFTLFETSHEITFSREGAKPRSFEKRRTILAAGTKTPNTDGSDYQKRPWLQSGGAKRPPGERLRQCEHAHVAGRSVFMEELLAELERGGVAFAAEEIGKK